MPRPTKRQQRKYQREWLADRRERWLDENGPCARCGSSECLEIDHIDPDDKVDHRVWSWSALRRKRELAKCQVLCHTCHREKTSREQRGENSPCTDMTEEQVWAIHRAVASGQTQLSQAEKYGVHHSTIYKIVRGLRWSHIYRAFHGLEQQEAA